MMLFHAASRHTPPMIFRCYAAFAAALHAMPPAPVVSYDAAALFRFCHAACCRFLRQYRYAVTSHVFHAYAMSLMLRYRFSVLPCYFSLYLISEATVFFAAAALRLPFFGTAGACCR